MKTAYRIGMAFWFAMAGVASPAAELALEGSKLMVFGALDGSALPAFASYVDSGQVRTVAFENSTGGTAEVAEAYARVIRDKGLLTEARGQCHAACAYAFLAGREHRFGRGAGFNALLVPLARRPAAGELQTTPAALPPKEEAWLPGQGVVFTSTPTLFGRVYNTYWCDGTQGTDFTRCERLSDADPYKLGVLTP